MLIHYIMELIKFQKNAIFLFYLDGYLAFTIYLEGGKTAWK